MGEKYSLEKVAFISFQFFSLFCFVRRGHCEPQDLVGFELFVQERSVCCKKSRKQR